MTSSPESEQQSTPSHGPTERRAEVESHVRTNRAVAAAAVIVAATLFAVGCASQRAASGEPAAHGPATQDVVEADGVAESQSSTESQEDPMEGITGDWSGAIEAGGQKLPLVFHIGREGDGLTATMDSPAQGAAGIPVDEVSFEGATLELVMNALAARYTGELTESGDAIVGTFRQGGQELDLRLTPVEEGQEQADELPPAAAPRRPQHPEPPYPYDTEDVRFVNEDAGVELAGTVTRPQGPGPFPAVVLVSGSGQQNRDEEIFGHKPFLVLADALTRAGIAVLRYDDRGVGGSGGGETLPTATSRDFAGDAAYALRFLMERPYVDRDRTGLVGHSEGALIAAMIAGSVEEVPTGAEPLPIDVDPAFVVMLAGNGVPGDELLMLQSAAVLRAAGASEDAVQQAARANRRLYDIVLADIPREEAAEQIAQIMGELGMNEDQIHAQQQQLLAPWFEFFLRYDPEEAVRRIDVPVLALVGELDVQVPPEQNIPALRDALEAAPTNDYAVRELEGLNHLLQPAQTGGVDEYAKIETTIAPEALDLMSGWIAERFGR